MKLVGNSFRNTNLSHKNGEKNNSFNEKTINDAKQLEKDYNLLLKKQKEDYCSLEEKYIRLMAENSKKTKEITSIKIINQSFENHRILSEKPIITEPKLQEDKMQVKINKELKIFIEKVTRHLNPLETSIDKSFSRQSSENSPQILLDELNQLEKLILHRIQSNNEKLDLDSFYRFLNANNFTEDELHKLKMIQELMKSKIKNLSLKSNNEQISLFEKINELTEENKTLRQKLDKLLKVLEERTLVQSKLEQSKNYLNRLNPKSIEIKNTYSSSNHLTVTKNDSRKLSQIHNEGKKDLNHEADSKKYTESIKKSNLTVENNFERREKKSGTLSNTKILTANDIKLKKEESKKRSSELYAIKLHMIEDKLKNIEMTR